MKISNVLPLGRQEDKLKKLEAGGVCDDSRQIKKGDIFFVRERKNFDIFSVLKQVEPKAALFVGEIKNKEKLKSAVKTKPVVFVKDINRVFRRAIDSFYTGEDNFEFIGVTGTNGKTTTAYLIYQLIKAMGRPVSLIGTVKYLVEGKTYKADYTTPDYLRLRKLLSAVKTHRKHFVVMEVSSHGLSQGRVCGIKFGRGVFMNLSRDHLDYHKTMAAYFNVKRKLFFHNPKMCSFINIDDAYGRRLYREAPGAVSFGLRPAAEVSARDIRLNSKRTCFNLAGDGYCVPVETSLLGRHNIYNLLAAAAVTRSLGAAVSDLVRFIPDLKGPAGRLERTAPDIFVDYAHTPDALTKVLTALREIGYAHIICVFGCGGDRDKGKRKLMGRVTGDLADYSFVTTDNSRGEFPAAICRQIEKGFKQRNYRVCLDRQTAISEAMKLKKNYKNCCVLVAGKGHENYQIIGNKKIPFDDKKIIRKLQINDRRPNPPEAGPPLAEIED